LYFYPADKTKHEEVIEVCNDKYDSLSLTGELQLVQKWEKLINERLKKKADFNRTMNSGIKNRAV